MDEAQLELKDKDEKLCPSDEMKINSPSPVQSEMLEFSTPKSGKRRKPGMFLHAGLEIQKNHP